jgi:hypothetical protein
VFRAQLPAPLDAPLAAQLQVAAQLAAQFAAARNFPISEHVPIMYTEDFLEAGKSTPLAALESVQPTA